MCICWAPLIVLAAVTAADGPSQTAQVSAESVPHEHVPVELEGTPIVARVPVDVQRPRRLLLDPAGNLFVADAAAGRVLRCTPHGDVTTVADGLDEPAGLAVDRQGRLCIANHAGGQAGRGSVVRIAPDGRSKMLIRDLTGPTALAFDARGVLHIALFEPGEIVALTEDGQTTVIAREVPDPAGLALTDSGELLVVSSTAGTLLRIASGGQVEVVARGLDFPTDIAVDSRGWSIVVQHGSDELVAIDDEGRRTTFARVPPGTIALALDNDDNPCLANWDFRLAMRMTIHLWIPCPHCDMRIPVRIRPPEQVRGVL